MVHLHRRSSSTMNTPSSQLPDVNAISSHHRHSLRNISSSLSSIIKSKNKTNDTSSSSSSFSGSSSGSSSVLVNTKNKHASRRKSVTKATLAKISETTRFNKLLTKKTPSNNAEQPENPKRRSWSGVLQGMKRRSSPPSLQQKQDQQQQDGLPPPAAIPPTLPNHPTPSTIPEEYHPGDAVIKESSHIVSNNEDIQQDSISINSISISSAFDQQLRTVREDTTEPAFTTAAAVKLADEKQSAMVSPSPPPPPTPPPTDAAVTAAAADAPVVSPSSPVFDKAVALLEEQLGRTSALELDGSYHGSRIEGVLSQLVDSSFDARDHPIPVTNVPLYFGGIVGTTASHDHYDQQGKRSTIVTGHCLATEPELVPKSLVLNDDYDQVMLFRRVTNNSDFMRLRYIRYIGHDEATTKFAKCPSSEWVPDHDVQACQHKACTNTFGLFMRRHHCRSCGQIFCYKHSANQLALFDVHDDGYSNSRVCDTCLYRLLQ